MSCALSIVEWFVVKFIYGVSGIIFHENVSILFFIVPFDIDSKVEFDLPVNSDIIVVFDRIGELMSAVFVEVFDTKVVFTEGECGFTCLMVTEAWYIWYGFIPIGGEFLEKLFEFDDAIFFKTICFAADFEVDMSISFYLKVVFFYGLLWDNGVEHMDVMVIGNG